MLRRRGCMLTQLLYSPSAISTSPLHRLISAAAAARGFAAAEDHLTRPQALTRSRILSSRRRLISGATAPSISPDPGFAAEEYLVSTCGLTRAQALKASPKICHLRSKFLCARVGKNLSPIVAELSALGLSNSEIARLLSYAPDKFRCRSIVPKLQYYLHLFGSSEKLLRAINFNTTLLCYKRKVELNVAFLRECGLGDCDIAKLCVSLPRMVTTNLEYVKTMVALAEGLGVPRGSGMLRHALNAVAFLDEKKIAAKVDGLKKTLMWSDAEVSIALPKAPFLLRKSKELLQRRSEFLISEVGLELAYLAQRSALLCYSLEGRMIPRYYAVMFLKENGLLKRDPSYYTVFKEPDKYFMEKFIFPHKEAAPHLAEDYAAACGGEVPARFRFT